jgi:hypothetical protein
MDGQEAEPREARQDELAGLKETATADWRSIQSGPRLRGDLPKRVVVAFAIFLAVFMLIWMVLWAIAGGVGLGLGWIPSAAVAAAAVHLYARDRQPAQ